MRFIRAMSWLGRHELGILVTCAALAGGVWGFVELADAVMEGGTRAFDEKALLALRNPNDRSDPIGPEWVEEIGRDLTALGGMAVLSMLSIAVAGFLALQRKYRAGLFVLAAVGSGLLASLLLKEGFDRPRPDLAPHGSYVMTTSFPSGHSMLSAVTYLTLGALLARVQPRRRLRAYLLILALTVTFLVGVSRVYLAVHWPTDVLSGWTAGIIWALACWLVARWLQKRGEIETQSGGETSAIEEGVEQERH